MRYLQRQRLESAAQHADKMRALLADNSRLDVANGKLDVLDKAAQKVEEEREGKERRAVRVEGLKREMHLGYLRAQLAQFEAHAKELEGVIGVRLDPVTQPETLRQVIDHFNEKHTLEDSLQMFWAAQRDEIEDLGDETFKLRAHTLKGAAQRTKQDAHAKEQDAQQDELQRAWGELHKHEAELEGEMKALTSRART